MNSERALARFLIIEWIYNVVIVAEMEQIGYIRLGEAVVKLLFNNS